MDLDPYYTIMYYGLAAVFLCEYKLVFIISLLLFLFFIAILGVFLETIHEEGLHLNRIRMLNFTNRDYYIMILLAQIVVVIVIIRIVVLSEDE